MSLLGYMKCALKSVLSEQARRKLLNGAMPTSLNRADWGKSLENPTSFYIDCFRIFHRQFPMELQEHRKYFTQSGRGFGEDAFHVMWHFLFSEIKPKNFLEIGVFRGQTISLAALLARRGKWEIRVFGISPFSSAGDSVSTYRTGIDYYSDTLRNFEYFNLPPPNLLRAFSTDEEAQKLIGSQPWDMIYIDGNHDYEIARRDWAVCSVNTKPGGIIVLDDAGLTTTFRPPAFATAGHPGPSKLANEIDRTRFREVMQVGHNRAFQKIV